MNDDNYEFLRRAYQKWLETQPEETQRLIFEANKHEKDTPLLDPETMKRLANRLYGEAIRKHPPHVNCRSLLFPKLAGEPSRYCDATSTWEAMVQSVGADIVNQITGYNYGSD